MSIYEVVRYEYEIGSMFCGTSICHITAILWNTASTNSLKSDNRLLSYDQKQLTCTCSDRHLEFKKNHIWLRNCRRVPSVPLCIKIKWFLSRVSTLTRDIDIAALYVCLSIRPPVCLSVRNVPVSDENGLTYDHSFFQRTVAQSFKFYQHQTSSRNSDGVTPHRER